MKKIIHTRKRYFALAGLFFFMGLGLALLPEKTNTKEINPDKLLFYSNDESRFVSTDDVAESLISQDPTLLYVDVRSPEEYEKISLEGAINIPLKDIFKKEYKDYLKRDDLKIILFSNDDILADQAWMLLRRQNKEDIFVMKGGLNEWVRTIMNPKAPADVASQDEFDLYQFRKAARRYFAGGCTEIIPSDYSQQNGASTKSVQPKSVKKTKAPAPIIKKAEKEEEEGC